jgi:hypothetical protein
MRHLERRHHFLSDHIEKGDVEMRYIDTESVIPNFYAKTKYSSYA